MTGFRGVQGIYDDETTAKEKRLGLPGSDDEIKEASDRNSFWQLLLNCLENNELNYTPHAPSARKESAHWR